MRTTFTPWYDEATEGRGLLHTGLAYSYRALGDETAQLRGRPESHLAPYVIDTGVINASEMQLIGAELAFVYGPFSFQSEYYGATVDEIGADDLSFNGCYAYVSYFLTGENRRYNRGRGNLQQSHHPLGELLPRSRRRRPRPNGQGCLGTGLSLFLRRSG